LLVGQRPCFSWILFLFFCMLSWSEDSSRSAPDLRQPPALAKEYPETIAAHVAPGCLQRYFVKKNTMSRSKQAQKH